MGQGGIDLATREGILDPAELTDDIEVKAAVVDDAGDLIVEWAMMVNALSITRAGCVTSPIIITPSSWLPEPISWTTDSMVRCPVWTAVRHSITMRSS